MTRILSRCVFLCFLIGRLIASEQTTECDVDATPVARGDVLLQKWVDGKPTLSAGALIPPHIFELSQQTDTHVRLLANGSLAPLSQVGYIGVAATCCNAEMEKFISRLVEQLGFVVCDVGGLTAFNSFFTCERGVKSFTELVQGIQDTPAKNPCPWIGTPGNCPVMSEDCRVEAPDTSYHRRRHCQLSWAQENLEDTSVIQARKSQLSMTLDHGSTTTQPPTKLTSTLEKIADKKLASSSTTTVTTAFRTTVAATTTTTTTVARTTTTTTTTTATTTPPSKSTATLTTTAKATPTTKIVIPTITKGPATTVGNASSAPLGQVSPVILASTTTPAANLTNASATLPSGARGHSRLGLWILALSTMVAPMIRVA